MKMPPLLSKALISGTCQFDQACSACNDDFLSHADGHGDFSPRPPRLRVNRLPVDRSKKRRHAHGAQYAPDLQAGLVACASD
jgi:hypothetical protein